MGTWISLWSVMTAWGSSVGQLYDLQSRDHGFELFSGHMIFLQGTGSEHCTCLKIKKNYGQFGSLRAAIQKKTDRSTDSLKTICPQSFNSEARKLENEYVCLKTWVRRVPRCSYFIFCKKLNIAFLCVAFNFTITVLSWTCNLSCKRNNFIYKR